MPLSLERIDAGLTAAFDEFLAAYEKEGGHLYPGFLGPDNPRSYKGPLFWAEGDCQWRLALALERQFSNMVHLEVPLARYTRRDFIKKNDVSQFIDIVVSDLSDFDHERDDFADRPFDVFVEVKFVGHGTSYKRVGERTISEGVKKDLERLKRHLDRHLDGQPRPWCRAAAMLIVDDASHVEGPPGQDLPWSPKIRPLLANPAQLKRRKRAKELEVTLPLGCPTCGSPRVAPILRGHPTIEHEQAAQRNELILGDDKMLGYDLDSPFGCLDCASKRALTQPNVVDNE